MSNEPNSVKIRSTEVRKKRKKLKTTREWYFTHVPNCFEFWLVGDIADVITCAEFYVNRFRGFGVLTARIFPFSMGLAGHPYNSVTLWCL